MGAAAGRCPGARPERPTVVQLLTAGYDDVLAGSARRRRAGQRRGRARRLDGRAGGGALTLASLRGAAGFRCGQAKSEWLPMTIRPALADKRVLVLGYGSIGRAIAARLTPFEVQVTAVASSARDGDDLVPSVHAVAELPSLLPQHDVVIVIVPLIASHHAARRRRLPGGDARRRTARQRRAGRGGRHRRAGRGRPPRPARWPRSTSPTRSRCRRATRCGPPLASSSPRTSAGRARPSARGQCGWCGTSFRRMPQASRCATSSGSADSRRAPRLPRHPVLSEQDCPQRVGPASHCPQSGPCGLCSAPRPAVENRCAATFPVAL